MNPGSIMLLATGAAIVALAPPNVTAASELKAAGHGNLAIRVQPESGTLAIRFRDRDLLVYASAPGQFKPYVRELRTLAGDNVLRDAPSDHLHHHGLMYAIRVNGVNFWEEVGHPGHERTVKLLSHNVGQSPEGLPQAAFCHLIHWITDKDRTQSDTTAAALLLERRTLVLTVNERAGEVALEWRGEFELGAGASKVTLTGSEYNGLGMRLPATFDRVAQYRNSENAPYASSNIRNVIGARWTVVSHGANGKEILIGLFAKPGAAGTTKFFSMLDPFAYLSVTQGLDQAPLEYSAGETFAVTYLVLVYSRMQSTEFLNQRYRIWTKSTPKISPISSPRRNGAK